MKIEKSGPEVKQLMSEAEWQTKDVYKREYLTTESLLMAILATQGPVSDVMASFGLSQESANRWILYRIGKDDFKHKEGSTLVVVGGIRLALSRASERTESRGATEVSVADIAIELLSLGVGNVQQMIKELDVAIDPLIAELKRVNGDLVEVEPEKVELMFHQLSKETGIPT